MKADLRSEPRSARRKSTSPPVFLGVPGSVPDFGAGAAWSGSLDPKRLHVPFHGWIRGGGGGRKGCKFGTASVQNALGGVPFRLRICKNL